MEAVVKPLFPLNLVAFPGEQVNLHIFEPRYRQLFQECEADGKTFVICPYHKGENVPYGTEMELLEIFKKYPNGKMDVKTRGLKPVRIEAFYKTMIGKLYGAAEIQYLNWDNSSDFTLNEKIIGLLKELYQITNVTNVEIGSAINFKTFQVAHKLGFSIEQEIEFLKIGSEQMRQVFVLTHLQKLVPILRDVEEMKRKALLNGHFKNLKPLI